MHGDHVFQDTWQRFDATLQRLWLRRLDVEAAIQQEQLKVARIKLWSLARSHALQSEKHLRY